MGIYLGKFWCVYLFIVYRLFILVSVSQGHPEWLWGFLAWNHGATTSVPSFFMKAAVGTTHSSQTSHDRKIGNLHILGKYHRITSLVLHFSSFSAWFWAFLYPIFVIGHIPYAIGWWSGFYPLSFSFRQLFIYIVIPISEWLPSGNLTVCYWKWT
jgi:hypothetical protein